MALNISGYGSVEVTSPAGSEVARFTGTNTYSGGTIITNGNVGGSVSVNSKLIFTDNSNAKSFKLLEGSNLNDQEDREVAGLSYKPKDTANLGKATVDLGSKTLTINNYENDVYAGLFTGTGSIIKKGEGYQTFSGTGNITQAVELKGGRLISDGSNGGQITGLVTVTGTGSLATTGVSGNMGSFQNVDVVDGGNLQATNNRLTVDQVDFQTGSTLTVATRGGTDSPELRGFQVTGDVNVASGSTVYLDLSNTLAWKPTEAISFISSNGGDVTGDFSQVEVRDLFLKGDVLSGNKIKLSADTDWASGYVGNSKTLRTYSRALALSAYGGDGESDWGQISLDLEALRDSFGDKGLRDGLVELLGPLNGISAHLQPGSSGWYSPMPQVSDLIGRVAPGAGDRPAGDNQFWFSPYYSRSSVDGSQGLPGYRLSRPGFNMGYDRRFSDEFTGGVMVGFSKPEAKVDDSRFTAEVNASQFLGGLYGAWKPGPVAFGGWAHYGFSDYSASRRATVGGERRNISADYDGQFWGMGLTADLPLALTERFTLIPNAGLSFNHSKVDGYTEKNGGILNQKVSATSQDTLLGRLGVKAEYQLEGGLFWASAHLNQVLSGDRVNEVSARFAGSNQPFVVESPQTDRTTYSLAAGADYNLTEGLSLNVTADADLGRRQQTYGISGGLKGVWGEGIDFWSPVAGLFTAASAGSDDGMVEKAPKFEGRLADIPVNYEPDDGFTLAEVVVTADGRQPVSERAASVDEITSAMIRETGSNTLSEALRPVTGLYQRTAGQGAPRIDIRGMRTRGVMLLVDGIPMSSARDNNFDPSQFPTANIERIKVTKGASSVIYGPGGNAGVINIITKKGQEGFSPSVGIEAGAPGATLTQRLAASMGNEKVKSFISYYGSQTDGFQPAKTKDDNVRYTTDKLRSNTQSQIHNVYANISYSPEDETEIGLSLNYRQGDYGIPVRTDRTRSRAEWETVDDWRATSVTLALRHEFDGPFTLRGWGYVNQEDRERSIYDDYKRTSQKVNDAGFFNSTNENYGIDTQLIYSPVDNFSATLALGAKRETYTAHDYYLSSNTWTRNNESQHATVTNSALELDYRPEALPGLGLSAGYGYYTQRRTEGTQNANSYMLGLSYDINDSHQIWANHARKVRFPNLEDYYDSTRGNQSLSPEIAKHYEIGWKGRFESLKSELAVTGFWVDADDFIENDEAGTGRKGNFDYRFRGIETTLAVRPIDWLMLKGGYTFTDAEDRDPAPYRTGNLQYRPRHKYSLAADMAFDSGIKFHLETHYLRDIYNTLKSSATTRDIKSDNYTVTHLKLGYDFGRASEVYIKAENIFDADYEESEGLPRPGRTIFLGLNLGF